MMKERPQKTNVISQTPTGRGSRRSRSGLKEEIQNRVSSQIRRRKRFSCRNVLIQSEDKNSSFERLRMILEDISSFRTLLVAYKCASTSTQQLQVLGTS
ncbi:hypothetical protein L596_011853 [Steinernema carpocapsae]|uniref:Uncharacterized protein n=1 Tax=Steinernema carpocapsae TaxID=34508 RepID=A0A4U5NVC0_STECR|nr:hypothetical protein L596_011853 [Steinernema carpocapsae]